MPKTAITTSDALRKQAWEEKLFRDTAVNDYFLSKFGGEAIGNLLKGLPFASSPNDIVHVKTNLGAKGRTRTKEGDRINFGLMTAGDPRTQAGVTSGQTLKGKEVALAWYSFYVELERYRQAVSAGSPIDWSRAAFDMIAEAKAWLQDWGSKKMEYLAFSALTNAPSAIFYKTSDTGPTVTKTSTLATAKAALTAADSKLTPEFVSYMKAWAITGGGRSGGQIPLRPVMVKGKPFFVLLVHPDALFDWKINPVVEQAHREALERNEENPIFQGADYIWDGVVIHCHEYVTTGTDGGGSTVPWNYGHFLGAQAIVAAFGERPSMVEDTEDYEEDVYEAWRVTMKIQKPVFNSLDYGSFAFLVSRTNVSGT